MKIVTTERTSMTIADKVRQINWFLIFILTILVCIGCAMLYSAAGASWDPWASRQSIRFGCGLVILISVSLVDIRVWMRQAYIIYILVFISLIAVEFLGVIGMGAQRWIDLGVFQFQPSEIMKVALVLALARFFHSTSSEDVGYLRVLLFPLLLVAAPVILVLRQPDLGTAIILCLIASVVFFLAGVRTWKFGLLFGVGLGSLPVIWSFLHSYQKIRILTYLNPENDPLGAGYHILQSKIALGSGGMFGKGFLRGTQSHLNFLPEKQTDFIFTMLAEEFGLIGGLVLLGVSCLILFYGYAIALRVSNQFGRLLTLGIIGIFFFHVCINIAMVMGLVPVVGVPLPFVSYGGTAMFSLMFGFGLVLCSNIHRDIRVSRYGAAQES